MRNMVNRLVLLTLISAACFCHAQKPTKATLTGAAEISSIEYCTFRDLPVAHVQLRVELHNKGLLPVSIEAVHEVSSFYIARSATDHAAGKDEIAQSAEALDGSPDLYTGSGGSLGQGNSIDLSVKISFFVRGRVARSKSHLLWVKLPVLFKESKSYRSEVLTLGPLLMSIHAPDGLARCPVD